MSGSSPSSSAAVTAAKKTSDDDTFVMLGNDDDDEDTVRNPEALERAKAIAAQQNESRRKVHVLIEEFGVRRAELERRVDAFRDKVDTLTCDNADTLLKELAEFMVSFYEENPIIYKNLASCCASIAALYAIKHFLLLLQQRIRDDGEEATNLEKEKFQLRPEFLRELYIDIINSLERSPGDPVKVLRYRDMLWPNDNNYLAFEKFIDEPTHKWLVESARIRLANVIEQRESGALTNVDGFDEQSLDQMVEYLRIIAGGGLPWDYYGEDELTAPRETLHYVRMLDPVNAHEFERTMTVDQFRVIQERAAVRLESFRHLNADAAEKMSATIKHLKSIVDGTPPFGYRLVEQKQASVFDQSSMKKDKDDENEEEEKKKKPPTKDDDDDAQ